jgi:uncharacterized protein YjbI with pentapeptide repeats
MIKKAISIVKQKWWVAIPLLVVFWLIYVGLNCNFWPEKNCTGFVGKTIWDVLELLIIPATLAIVAAFLDKVERKADRENANKKAEVDREISKENQQEASLQSFYDVLTRLLLEYKLRQSKDDDGVKKIATVKTISTIETLNINRKNKLLIFLCELGLLDDDFRWETGVCISLDNAVLDGCDFSNMFLEKAEFKLAHLEDANFENAEMQYCIFERANLKGAILQWANFDSSNLEFANLQEANLVGAHLEKVRLQDANLQNANLEGAHLKGANLQRANLIGANFKGAIMPDGKVYDQYIHTTEYLTSDNLNLNH